MTDKTAFDDNEWKALIDAPLLVTFAMVAVGDHGPISMVKESAATARLLAQPGDRGAATELVAAIAAEAESKETRHDMKEHRKGTIDQVLEGVLPDLKIAAAALAKLPGDEGQLVGRWLVDMAQAVSAASKGVKPEEQRAVEAIAAVFGVTAN